MNMVSFLQHCSAGKKYLNTFISQYLVMQMFIHLFESTKCFAVVTGSIFIPPRHSVVWSAHNDRNCVCVTGSFLIPRKMFPEIVKNDNFGRFLIARPFWVGGFDVAVGSGVLFYAVH